MAALAVSLLSLLYLAALLESHDDVQRHNEKPMLLTLAVALSFYPFLSRCLHSFGDSMIGNGDGPVVSERKWRKIEKMCFAD